MTDKPDESTAPAARDGCRDGRRAAGRAPDRRRRGGPATRFEGPALELGGLMLDATELSDVRVRIPLGMLNRHGLVAGATGTGKTKTLQLLAEQLSAPRRPGLRGRHQGRPLRA